MNPSALESGDWVLVTGATGFLGPALVHELLSRGRRVLCLVRAPTPGEARERVTPALRAWTDDVERLLETGRLAILRGDVCLDGAGAAPAVRSALRGRVTSLVHAAGNTHFAATSDGEPQRTNVTGTERVLALARELDCRDWRLISTAYVAGAANEAYETLTETPPTFRNAYERSKWEAEQLATRAACNANATLTIYRPSVIVGHSETGRTTGFMGVYYLFRATALLARAVSQRGDVDRHAIPLRISVASRQTPNLICIDDVAGAFGELFDNPQAVGGVFHLTHPAPPTNAQIRRALEAFYDVSGGRFADERDDALPSDATGDALATSFQKLFDEMTEPVRDYLFDAPRFDRTRVDQFTRRRPTEWTDERLHRLIAAADVGGWRAAGYERQLAEDVGAVALYFLEHLPRGVEQSTIGRVGTLELNVRFEIGRRAAGRWWCSFRQGRVVAVEPAVDQPTDVTYKTSESRFWAAVAGEITGAELFLSGEAQIEGDIERALKFAALLETFVRERPYRPNARGADTEGGPSA